MLWIMWRKPPRYWDSAAPILALTAAGEVSTRVFSFTNLVLSYKASATEDVHRKITARDSRIEKVPY
jgi:hypothetical protein